MIMLYQNDMEFIDIVNKEDEVIGKEERNTAHKKDLLHRAVHILILNKNNEVLCQLRKATKKQYPLHWHGSAAGHVPSGETAENTAKKELEEELGISIHLENIGKFIIHNKIEHELVSIFLGRSDGPFKMDKSEIKELKFISLDKLKQGKHMMKTTPHFDRAVDLLAKKVSKN